MANGRCVVQKLCALLLQLTQRLDDIVDLEADVKQSFPSICDPLRGARIGVVTLKQLKRALADRKHREANRIDLLLVFKLEIKQIGKHFLGALKIFHRNSDMLNPFYLHCRCLFLSIQGLSF